MIVRRRRQLVNEAAPGLIVPEHEIGEGSADINSYPLQRPPPFGIPKYMDTRAAAQLPMTPPRGSRRENVGAHGGRRPVFITGFDRFDNRFVLPQRTLIMRTIIV